MVSPRDGLDGLEVGVDVGVDIHLLLFKLRLPARLPPAFDRLPRRFATCKIALILVFCQVVPRRPSQGCRAETEQHPTTGETWHDRNGHRRTETDRDECHGNGFDSRFRVRRRID